MIRNHKINGGFINGEQQTIGANVRTGRSRWVVVHKRHTVTVQMWESNTKWVSGDPLTFETMVSII